MIGIVKWFNVKRGYGFITADEVDYFVHFKSIEQESFKILHPGQSVTFTPDKNPKGFLALMVNTSV